MSASDAPERLDTGVPYDGRKELPKPGYEGEMLLQSHRTEPERVEIRLSMTLPCYKGLKRKADEHGVDPVNLMDDLVEAAAGETPRGWCTGLTVDYTDDPLKKEY